MKTYLKYIVFAAVVIYALFQYRSTEKVKRLSQLQAIELSTIRDTVIQYKTKSGELYYKWQGVEIEKKNLRDALELAGIDTKTLKDENIKWRNLVNVLELKLASIGEGQTLITDTFLVVEYDTVWFQKVEPWTNGYLSLFDATIKEKQLDFSYRYDVAMKIFQTKEKDKTIITVDLNDTHAVITTGNSIIVENKRRFYQKPWVWGTVGILAGYAISR